MEAIFKRRSIRKYNKDIDVTKEQIEKVLRAGMAAPSAGDGREWEFVVFRSQEIKDKIMKVHDHSKALETAPVGIVVCADIEKQAYKEYDWWIQDCAAAIENMLIEATFLGLGSLWLGIHSRAERVEGVKEIFGLPESVMPVGIVVLGTPEKERRPIDRYMDDRVHFEKF